MSNYYSLLASNASLPPIKTKINDGYFVYQETRKTIGAMSLRDIIRFINTLLARFPGAKLPVILDLNEAKFIDKISYILLECLCYDVIENHGYRVTIKLATECQIHTAGIRSSPLWLLSTGRQDHIEKFKAKFMREVYKNHYRRVLTKTDFEQPDLLCKIMDDVAWFQKVYDVDTDCRDAISEVIVELIGNASEHGGLNCLVDFDVAPSYRKKGADGEFVGINIAIVNFSKNLLGSSLREKIKNEEKLMGRDSVVAQAYEFHSNHFDSDYTEDDFFAITAFQHKISSRCNSMYTGGTGLTKLIESLSVRSDANMCYVSSGLKTLAFKQEYLTYNDSGWLGFNKENDYVSAIPDRSVFGKNCFLMPGTAYNLNFVMQKEKNHGE